MHLICLPAASIDDRQLYLGIVRSLKEFRFLSRDLFHLHISHFRAYCIRARLFLKQNCFACPTCRYHSTPVISSLCDILQIPSASKVQFCNHMHA